MIPILYAATEINFLTNGLGALSDAATCTVKEAKNGSYELDMTYPIKGRHYKDIALGAIVFAQPADGKDPQPFEIYNISTPINDIVTISAHHISYRLSYVPVAPITMTGASATLNAIKTSSIETHPFTVWTDLSDNESKFSILYPSSFRECIGGTDDSFLTVFGGELEWDKFNVKIHAHRGSDNGVRIAYSKNLTDFTNKESNEDVVTGVYPYWVNSETGEIFTCGIVYAVKDSGYNSITGESAPTWESNKYYRIKPSGYYQNDEDLVPNWIANKYYSVKLTGYYNVEGDVAPTWESNRYYSVLPYGYFHVQGVNAAVWELNKYYKNNGTSAAPNFSLLTEQPSDWSTAYNTYYIYYGFYKLNDATAPAWTYGIYYKNNATESGKWDMELLVSAPDDWDTNWTSYFKYLSPQNAIAAPDGSHAYETVPAINAPEWVYDTYYENSGANYIQLLNCMVIDWKADTYYKREGSEGAYTYVLTTEEPDDWFTNYTTYFVKEGVEYIQVSTRLEPEWKVNTYYKKEGTDGDYSYTLTAEKPSDWSTTYTGYFVKDDSNFELQTAKPSDWEDNYAQYFYHKDPEYILTESEPANWSTDYKGYFVYYVKDDNIPIYILTTSEPSDWYTNYNDYYTYYEQAEGIVNYLITTSQPDDWSTNYADYFTYWEEYYNSDYPYSRTISVDFSSYIDVKPTERLLKRLANAYMATSLSMTNTTSLEISFVALWQTEEYKNIAPLERVNLCDTVTVDFKEENSISSVKLQVIETDYDVLAEQYTSIRLGESTSSLSSTISNMNNSITKAVAEAVSNLENAIARQADLMNGGLGGNVKINYNGNGRPCEIIVGNSDDISKMTQCLRINYKGIGFSKNGYAGPYTSIWGLDGEFDAQCIKAGTIDGSSIKADTIQASSITEAAKESLLSEVNDSLSKLLTGWDNFTELSGWLHIEDGHLYIGDEQSTIVIVEGSFIDGDGQVQQKISFIDRSYTPPRELAYISNNCFYTNELMLGGYELSASENAEEGISFRWTKSTSGSN